MKLWGEPSGFASDLPIRGYIWRVVRAVIEFLPFVAGNIFAFCHMPLRLSLTEYYNGPKHYASLLQSTRMVNNVGKLTTIKQWWSKIWGQSRLKISWKHVTCWSQSNELVFLRSSKHRGLDHVTAHLWTIAPPVGAKYSIYQSTNRKIPTHRRVYLGISFLECQEMWLER